MLQMCCTCSVVPPASLLLLANIAVCHAGGSRQPSRRGAATPARCHGCAVTQQRCRRTAATLAPARPAPLAAPPRWHVGTHAASRCATTHRLLWCHSMQPRRLLWRPWAQHQAVRAASSGRHSSSKCHRRRQQLQRRGGCWRGCHARQAATSPCAPHVQSLCPSPALAGTPLCRCPAAAQRRLHASSAAGGRWRAATTAARRGAMTRRPSHAGSAACTARWRAAPASTLARCHATRPARPARRASSPSPGPATAARPP